MPISIHFFLLFRYFIVKLTTTPTVFAHNSKLNNSKSQAKPRTIQNSKLLNLLHAVISEPASEAVLALAIAVVELYERLRVGCIIGRNAALAP